MAASFRLSPGKLYFDVNLNEKNCQNIVLSSEDYLGEVNIRDVWAKNIDEGYNINNYSVKSEDLGIKLDYNKLIENFDGSEEVEVCLSGNKIGESKGAIIFTPKSETNIVVEVGTWLMVNVTESQQTQPTNLANIGSDGGGFSIKTVGENSEAEEDKVAPEEQSEKITSKAVQDILEDNAGENENLELIPKERNYTLWGIIAVLGLFIFSILIIRTINIRKRRNKNGF